MFNLFLKDEVKWLKKAKIEKKWTKYLKNNEFRAEFSSLKIDDKE